jgi:hypothetical protein
MLSVRSKLSFAHPLDSGQSLTDVFAVAVTGVYDVPFVPLVPGVPAGPVWLNETAQAPAGHVGRWPLE